MNTTACFRQWKTWCSWALAAGFAAASASTALALEWTWQYAVQAYAEVTDTSITLKWPQDPNIGDANHFDIRRRAFTNGSWGSWGSVHTVAGNAVEYPDGETIQLGTRYEYEIHKYLNGGNHGYGYIQAGIKIPVVEHRGRVILVVENAVVNGLPSKLQDLKDDLTGDGWTVVQVNVASTDSASAVHTAIAAAYSSSAVDTAVLLLGAVPFPMSGSIAPDGHENRPFPADGYYGAPSLNWGSGSNFSPNSYDGSIVMQVGRVDFRGLSDIGTGKTELELIARYIDKARAFRRAAVRPQRRGIIGNRIGDDGGRAPAASAYRAFSTFFRAENVDIAQTEDATADADRWITRLKANSYLWAFGSGGGSSESVAQLGTQGEYHNATSSDFAAPGAPAKGMFYMLFGSYFGDYSQPKNLMRSALAAENYGLAAAWSGRPNYYFHHMGLGDTVGYGIRLSQNNNGEYANQSNVNLRSVHIGLVGDPTLRLHPVPPVRNLNPGTNGAVVTWDAPSLDTGEVIEDLRVYKYNSSTAKYEFVETLAKTATSYSSPSNGNFMIRVRKLETSGSGSYYNLSQGMLWTASTGGGDTTPPTVASFTLPSTGSSTLTYQIAFSENVTGVDASDFTTVVTGNASASVTSVTGSGTTYSIGVSFSGSTGSVGLNLKSSGTGIVDASSNAIQSGSTGPVHTLPSSGTWTGQDIGSVGATGSDSFTSTTATSGTVTGSGADIWETTDSFRFVTRTITGDVTVVARVNSLTQTDAWAKAGVMIRDGTAANAAYAMAYTNPTNGSGLQARATAGASSSFTGGPYSWLPGLWLKLQRSGNVFTAYTSQDGTTWANAGSVTIAMSSTVYVGLAVTAHNNGQLSTGSFDNVSVTGTPSSGWSGADIGNTSPAGSQNISGASGTVTGAGADIWDTTDAFHFAYKTVTGDTTIVAHVTGVTQTNDWAKAGVMIRDGTAANAAFAMAYTNPTNSSGLITRATAGASCVADDGPYSWLDVWVKLQRSGNVFTAYTSQDGTTWHYAGSRTITMSATVTVGLAVTSHNNGTLCTGTFDNVAITP